MATLKHGQTGDRYLLTVTNKASTDFHQAIPPPIEGLRSAWIPGALLIYASLSSWSIEKGGRLHPSSTDQARRPSRSTSKSD